MEVVVLIKVEVELGNGCDNGIGGGDNNSDGGGDGNSGSKGKNCW